MFFFNIITLFPDIFKVYLNISVLKKGREKKIFDYNIINLRDFGLGRHKKVDDYPYGGGSGMIIRCEPLFNALNSIKNKGKVIFFTPKGKTLNQDEVKKFKEISSVYTLICGRYEGIDQRIIDNFVDFELSIGDYVLTGGELPALVFIDAVVRQLRNFIKPESVKNESFENILLDYPHYTKPREFLGMKVPDVLLSGDHKKINEWRFKKQLELTKKRRPDLYKKYQEEINELN